MKGGKLPKANPDFELLAAWQWSCKTSGERQEDESNLAVTHQPRCCQRSSNLQMANHSQKEVAAGKPCIGGESNPRLSSCSEVHTLACSATAVWPQINNIWYVSVYIYLSCIKLLIIHYVGQRFKDRKFLPKKFGRAMLAKIAKNSLTLDGAIFFLDQKQNKIWHKTFTDRAEIFPKHLNFFLNWPNGNCLHVYRYNKLSNAFDKCGTLALHEMIKKGFFSFYKMRPWNARISNVFLMTPQF